MTRRCGDNREVWGEVTRMLGGEKDGRDDKGRGRRERTRRGT